MREWQGTLDEDIKGVELYRLVAKHWHVGVMDGLEINEAMTAAQTMGVSLDELFDGMESANRERGIDDMNSRSVLQHGFVPAENVSRVCDLLNQIQDLCLRD